MTPAAARLPVARPDTGDAEATAAAAVLASGWMGRGERSEAFEDAVRARTGARHVVAVVTGTAALHLALDAAGIGPGDEVVVPSLTFCATYQAVVATGARPRFADIDPDTLCLDPGDVEQRLGPATRAVLPMHFGGFAGGRPELAALVEAHGLVLVEDAAHAFGSTTWHDGRETTVGGTGNPVCFSFDPIKAVTCGQGGAVCTDDDALAETVRLRSDLGMDHRRGRQAVVDRGLRYALSDLNAAIGLAQLAGFDQRVARRRELWRAYAEAFDGVEGIRLPRHDVAAMVPFSMTVRVDAGCRDDIRARLAGRGIDTSTMYPPGHHQEVFAGSDRLPATDLVAAEIVALPFFVGMSDEDVARVCAELIAAVRRTASPAR